MRLWGMVVLMAIVGMTVGRGSADEYRGRYCSGSGDLQYLQLVDKSFGFFHPNSDTPNISMLYYPDWDCMIEGFPSWMAWWIQNSYGPTYCSLPFLQEPYLTFVQHSQDMWFANQGDGKKHGYDQFAELVGPDGCLCDCAIPTGAIYRQGDYNWRIHDWAFEFTAAGVVLQSELLLVQHDKAAARKYLPNLERACNFIETRRDAKNGLFLAGPGANLLAPSYGGIKQADGTFGMGYLAGLSVSYLAACDRMVELFKLVGDADKVALYEHRRTLTKDSLPLLETPEGYFIKAMAPDGTKHGVFGQKKYGYFEAAPNVDAVCFRAVDQPQAEKIFAKIASIPQLRPHDLLITNYPSLDDTYVNWDSTQPDGLFEYGRWVNGGFWATMEARAIMAYYRVGRYEDIRRSNLQCEKFIGDFQMDAPLTDFGNEVWFKDRQTNLCYDALGIPAATIRGLFEYVYSADSLALYPHIPPFIREYTQKELIRFGEKRIMITITNGGPRVKSLKVNDVEWKVVASDHVTLDYDKLPQNAWVVIETEGGWPTLAEQVPASRQMPLDEALVEQILPELKQIELPDNMRKQCDRAVAMQIKLCAEPGNAFERAYLDEVIKAFGAYRDRGSRDSSGWYAKMTPEKRAAILKMYEDAALNLYKGFDALMQRYRNASDPQEKRLALTWVQLGMTE